MKFENNDYSKMIDVHSSSIKSIGYDEDLEILYINFKNNSSYQYFDVPEAVAYDLLNAFSVGEHFSNYIRPFYNYAPVE